MLNQLQQYINTVGMATRANIVADKRLWRWVQKTCTYWYFAHRGKEFRHKLCGTVPNWDRSGKILYRMTERLCWYSRYESYCVRKRWLNKDYYSRLTVPTLVYWTTNKFTCEHTIRLPKSPSIDRR
jgi:hypothetical protein